MFTEGDLPITADGRIYHLALRPEELAENIILVGDPDRVPVLAEQCIEHVEVDVFHRGLRSITGRAKEYGFPVSIITSGMGTPSLEIVLQEIAALKEIDFTTRQRKAERPQLRLIRIGTSGAIHQDLPLGTAVLSEYALGLDNTGLFYDLPSPDEVCDAIEQEALRLIAEGTPTAARFHQNIQPYASRAGAAMQSGLQKACEELEIPHRAGITISSSGFFGAQGRAIAPIELTVPDIDRLFSRAELSNTPLRFENMEMEASFLLHFAAGMDYEAGVICVAIANREHNTFAMEYQNDVRNAARAAFRAFAFNQTEES